MIGPGTGAGRPRRPHPLRLDGGARLAGDLRQRRLQSPTSEVIRSEIFWNNKNHILAAQHDSKMHSIVVLQHREGLKTDSVANQLDIGKKNSIISFIALFQETKVCIAQQINGLDKLHNFLGDCLNKM